jgi:hypothetical protein
MLKQYSKKSKKSKIHYRTIDECPIRVWFKVHRDGDLSHLGEGKEVAKVWESMYNDYLKRFGLPESVKKEMTLKNSLARLQADYVITGKRHLLAQIAYKKEEIKKKVEISEPEDIESILAKVSKWYGFSIKSSISVAQYYAYLNEMRHG